MVIIIRNYFLVKYFTVASFWIDTYSVFAYIKRINEASQTHGNVKKNWINSHAKKKLDNKQIRKYVEICLKLGFSPLTIAERLREKYGFKIHHETIYQYIYKEKTDWAKYLLRSKLGRKSRQKFKRFKAIKSKIPNRTDIDFREEAANLRLEFGHFEADSVSICVHCYFKRSDLPLYQLVL